MAVHVFDLDGTLLHHGNDEPRYDDPRSLHRSTRPFEDRCAYVRGLIEAGHEVYYLTGRSEAVRAVTMSQVRRFIHQDTRHDHLIMQTAFTGYGPMAMWKAVQLGRVDADSYTGDHPADALAAARANVPFTHADLIFLEVDA